MITAEALVARTQDAYRRGVEDGRKVERERCLAAVRAVRMYDDDGLLIHQRHVMSEINDRIEGGA